MNEERNSADKKKRSPVQLRPQESFKGVGQKLLPSWPNFIVEKPAEKASTKVRNFPGTNYTIYIYLLIKLIFP